MAYKNKTYVCFDGDTDIKYYNLMKAWKQNDNSDFDFYDAHDINTARDTSLEETIKNKLKIRLNNTKIFVILLGEHTKYLTKFVKWEIEEAIKMELPIIVVNLNGKRTIDSERLPLILKEKLSISISFNSKIMQYALEDWEARCYSLKKDGKLEPRYYIQSVYDKLEI